MTSNPSGHLYFHSPCFDGIASAVLMLDYMAERNGWMDVALEPVNYHLKDTWLQRELHRPCAVVDFLYHPQADAWADHHATTHLDPKHAADRGPLRIYDRAASSCALLLWNELFLRFQHRNLRYAELVRWADKIDAARYDSPEEAVFPTAPALRINAALSMEGREDLSVALVHRLRDRDLDHVARNTDIQERMQDQDRKVRDGQQRLERAMRIADGIAVFDVDGTGVQVSRYGPYLPAEGRRARYSAGIVRDAGVARITMMRNPWLEFESVHLGELAARHGGGGHQRVGAIELTGSRIAQAGDVLQTLVRGIQDLERHTVGK